MLTTTPVVDRPHLHLVEATPSPAVAPRRPRQWFAAAMVAGGLAFMTAAAGVLTQVGDRDGSRPAPAVDASAGRLALTLSGPGDVSMVTQVYEPGEASGWHAHTGIHAVSVLSGSLTVYDEQCRPQTFGPGRPYIGGQELHLVRNEAQVPVEMVVTYMSAAGPNNSTRHLPPPAACPSGAPAQSS